MAVLMLTAIILFAITMLVPTSNTSGTEIRSKSVAAYRVRYTSDSGKTVDIYTYGPITLKKVEYPNSIDQTLSFSDVSGTEIEIFVSSGDNKASWVVLDPPVKE